MDTSAFYEYFLFSFLLVDAVFFFSVSHSDSNSTNKTDKLQLMILLKGYSTHKSRSCFCLHCRPKDDVAVSILVQGKSLSGTQMLRYLYVFVLDLNSDLVNTRGCISL